MRHHAQLWRINEDKFHIVESETGPEDGSGGGTAPVMVVDGNAMDQKSQNIWAA